MDGRVTKGIIAISITALVGGSYRLISYYKGNTKLDLLVPTSFDVTAKDIEEMQLTNSSESREQSLLEGRATVISPSKPSTEQKRQNPVQEAVVPAKRSYEPSNYVSDLAQIKTSQSPPPTRNSLKVHKQEIEISGRIEAELLCTGKLWNKGNLSSKDIETLFKWTLPLTTEYKENLRKNKTFAGPALVTITRKDNGKKLWDSYANNDEKVKGIQIKWNTSGTIAITLKNWVEGIRDGGNMQQRGSYQKTFLYCQNNGLGAGKGEVLYKHGEIEISTSGKKEIAETPMTTQVSLIECTNRDNSKTQECALKVVTRNRLNWGKKVEAKAILITGEK